MRTLVPPIVVDSPDRLLDQDKYITLGRFRYWLITSEYFLHKYGAWIRLPVGPADATLSRSYMNTSSEAFNSVAFYMWRSGVPSLSLSFQFPFYIEVYIFKDKPIMEALMEHNSSGFLTPSVLPACDPHSPYYQLCNKLMFSMSKPVPEPLKGIASIIHAGYSLVEMSTDIVSAVSGAWNSISTVSKEIYDKVKYEINPEDKPAGFTTPTLDKWAGALESAWENAVNELTRQWQMMVFYGSFIGDLETDESQRLGAFGVFPDKMYEFDKYIKVDDPHDNIKRYVSKGRLVFHLVYWLLVEQPHKFAIGYGRHRREVPNIIYVFGYTKAFPGGVLFKLIPKGSISLHESKDDPQLLTLKGDFYVVDYLPTVRSFVDTMESTNYAVASIFRSRK